MTEQDLIKVLDTKISLMHKLEDLLGVEKMKLVSMLLAAEKKITCYMLNKSRR